MYYVAARRACCRRQRRYRVQLFFCEDGRGYKRHDGTVSSRLSAVLCPHAIPVRAGEPKVSNVSYTLSMHAPVVYMPACVILKIAGWALWLWPPQVVKFVIVLYLGLTPFAIVDKIGWLTPAGAFILSLLFLAVDEIGAEIEDPFGACECKSPTAADAAPNTLYVVREVELLARLLCFGGWLSRCSLHFGLFFQGGKTTSQRLSSAHEGRL